MAIIRNLIPDQIGYPRLAKYNRALWAATILFHFSFAAIIFGHLRLIQEPTWLWSLLGLGQSGVEMFALYAGGIAGLIFSVAILGMTYRRLRGIVQKISVPEDYLLLTLLLLIAATGLYIRFYSGLSVPQLQEYFAGLLTLKLVLTPAVLTPLFIVHFALTQLFFIYFPFSKLVHLTGSFITNYIYKR
jgi:nitrate reductase gamma subunit